jgi:hypothetical protein
MGALLVSPFNVDWGCYAWAGGVEESEFCLFLVVFLVRCISSISSRFYFRKHAFCFLPLVSVLESAPMEVFNTRFSFPFNSYACKKLWKFLLTIGSTAFQSLGCFLSLLGT